MNKTTILFIAGTIGIVFTSVFHFFLIVANKTQYLQYVCMLLYLVFISLLVPAFRQVRKEHKTIFGSLRPRLKLNQGKKIHKG